MKTYRPLNFFQRLVIWFQIAFILLPANCPQLWAQAFVTRVQINQGDPSRSTVTNIAVTFNTNVAIASPNLVLQNLTLGTNLPATNLAFSFNTITHEATWTFPGLTAGSLPEGNWLAGLPAPAVTDATGTPLIGTPFGLPGDPLAFQFHRYFGDVNGDRDVDFADTYSFKSTWLRASNQAGFDSRFDFNGDGVVNSNDLSQFNSHYFTLFASQPGIFAALANDTGVSATNSTTADPTVSGTVFRTNNSASFRAALTTNIAMFPPSFFNVSTDLTTSGTFRFDSNRLAQISGGPILLGTNILYLQTVETNGLVSSTFKLPFILESGCNFQSTNGWTINIAQASVPGSVVFAGCEAVMTEGDSFTVTLEKALTIPSTPGLLSIQYIAPTFDSSSTNLMRDAFEAALVDSAGHPLTFSIQGSADISSAAVSTPPALPPSPDSFFNHSDGRTPVIAPGVALVPSTLNPQLSILSVDISQMTSGSTAKLILRLVNNDRDRATTVRIKEVSFKPFDSSLNFGGSSSPALSSLSHSASSLQSLVSTSPAVSGKTAQLNATSTKSMAGAALPQVASGIAPTFQFPVATNITVNSNYTVEIFSTVPGACALAYPPEGSAYGHNLYVTTDPTPVSDCSGLPSEIYRISPDGVANRITLLNGSYLEAFTLECGFSADWLRLR